jgi:hypothetical protein
MQHLQKQRASTIVATAAAIILVFTCQASAQASSQGRLDNEDTVVQGASAVIPHRYRSAQWLDDILPDEAPGATNDESFYGGDMAFLSIFWAAYIPVVIGILWPIGGWVMRSFHKLRGSFPSRIATHVRSELRNARSGSAPGHRG